MPETFINKIEKIVLSNLENEKFGVSELAAETGLSRSQVLRKIRSLTDKSANHLIREIRLKEAAKFIQSTDLTASEIAYKTGFSSPSYFNKCFLDEYGFTPGDYKKRLVEGIKDEQVPQKKTVGSKIAKPVLIVTLIMVVAIIGYYVIVNPVNKTTNLQASIAVLPFNDFSENQDHEYLADGITEILTRDLSKLKELRVPSRTSSMKFKGEKLLSSEIARQLKVKLILEGSVLRTGDSVLVTVQLIEVIPEEKHLWAESYSAGYKNIHQLIDKISNETTGNVSTVLNIPQGEKKVTNVDPKAYELYLRGQHILNHQKTRDSSMRKVVEYVEQSIEIDPDFAPAYVTLAETYLAMNTLTGDNVVRLMNRENARKAVDKALELDKSLAEAYVAKGNLAGRLDGDWEKMKDLAEKGLELEPSNAGAHLILSNYYVVKGIYRKAIEEALKAEELDPVNPVVGCLVAERYYISGNLEKAIKKNLEVIGLNPNYGWAYHNIGFVYMQAGDPEKAVDAWQQLQIIRGHKELYDCYDEHAYQYCFQFFIDNAKNNHPRFCSNPMLISMVQMLVDDKQGALEFLDIALEYKNEDLPVMITYPDFYALHENPKFQEIIHKAGIVIPDR